MTVSLLHDLLDRRAAASGGAPALTCGDRTWNYAELARWSAAAAGWLREHGAGRGDRVVILGGNTSHAVPLIFAASRLGAVFVPVSDQQPARILGHVLADCVPRLVAAAPGAAGAARELTTAPVLDMAELPAPPRHPVPAPGGRPCPPSGPLTLIYTSGSTAWPKAVVSPHRQVLFAVHAIQRRLGYAASDTVFCCLPLSFDYGLYQIFLACAAGARLVLAEESDAGPPLAVRLAQQDASVLPLVPSMAVTLCRLLRRGGAVPRSLRMVTNTGADLAAPLCQRLRSEVPGLAVVAMFGLTECKRVSIAEPNSDLTRPGTVGRPLPGTEVLVTGDDGRPAAPGEPGGLLVRGPHVMAGYWNAPELTAARFRRDALGQPVLHTGDLCRVDEDGYLYFLGRADDIYKQRGVRVSATEVEAAALEIPGVELAAALPPDGRHGARVAVTGDLTPVLLADGLRARLGAAKVPGDCRVVPALPLAVNGKIDRRALAAHWPPADGTSPPPAGVAAGARP
jgi:amino acid adenylation domain-containing protein